MKEIIRAVSNILLFGVLIILAIWLSPFILIGVFVYLGYIIYRAREKKKVLEQIKREWFSKGKYAIFAYSNSTKWKNYFEQEFIPKIENKAIVWNWSTRQQQGWNNDLLEAKALRFFKTSRYFYPVAIVFPPSDKVRVFNFYTPYIKMIKSQSKNQDYKNLEKEFLDTLESL